MVTDGAYNRIDSRQVRFTLSKLVSISCGFSRTFEGLSWPSPGSHGVVPVTVVVVPREVEGQHFVVRELTTGWIVRPVHLSFDL